MPVLHGRPVREGILNAVESITTLDASFWFEFADAEAPRRAHPSRSSTTTRSARAATPTTCWTS